MKCYKKVLIIGPWVGEFSYEISWAIPLVRETIKKNYSDFHVIALGFPGRKALYEDFVDEYIPHPSYLSPYLIYPSMAYQFVNGKEVTPQEFKNYTEYIKNQYEAVSEQVEVITVEMGKNHALQENPQGEFIHYNNTPIYDSIVKTKLNNCFLTKKNEILVVAREKIRNGKIDGENLNPLHWGEFIEKIVKELDANIILLGIPNKESRGGTLSLSQLNLDPSIHPYITYYSPEKDTSVGEQISLLKRTKCSIYGATGAATLAFFTNTPLFTQQTKNNGWRLNFPWQHRLTDNHKNVRIFDDYPLYTIWDTPPNELFDNFKKFYLNL